MLQFLKLTHWPLGDSNIRKIVFKLILAIDGWCISCEIALKSMSSDLIVDKSTMVQLMAWCRQTTSHYLNPWWAWYLSPYGITRPQWVNSFWQSDTELHHIIFADIGKGKGLLPDSIKPLPISNVDLPSLASIPKMTLKIILLKNCRPIFQGPLSSTHINNMKVGQIWMTQLLRNDE